MRIISWNINRRVKDNPEQLQALQTYNPDIVALQEVMKNALPNISDGLRRFGLVHIEESVELATQEGNQYSGELIASRWPLERFPSHIFDIPYPELAVSVLVDSPWGNFEVHTIHIPNGSGAGWDKITTCEGIFNRQIQQSGTSQIICGDLNTPQAETPDGQIVTWGQELLNGKATVWGKWKGDTGERWDRGERNLLQGLSAIDVVDIFRALHGYNIQEFSYYRDKKDKTSGVRFDHILASRYLNPITCRYIHEWREQNLSDHSAIEGVFAPSS